ncbi:MAG: TfoX/Sxy family protein [Sphingomonadales bacterium]
MAVGKEFIEFVVEVLAPFGVIRVKRMFGGAGVFADGLFFAILDDDQLYLKADSETQPGFEAEGLKPFTFTKKDGSTATLRYFAAPEEVFEDPELMKYWVDMALGAALRKARKN